MKLKEWLDDKLRQGLDYKTGYKDGFYAGMEESTRLLKKAAPVYRNKMKKL